jgi:hypothetical protein
MSLSELTNRITEPSKVNEIVALATTHVALTYHPKIRYAAYHLIGEISEHQEESFQSAHHANIVPMLVAGMLDPVPRVQSHCISAVTNFMEGMPKTVAVQYCPNFLPPLIGLINPNNCSLIIEHALTAVVTVAKAAKESFVNWYP